MGQLLPRSSNSLTRYGPESPGILIPALYRRLAIGVAARSCPHTMRSIASLCSMGRCPTTLNRSSHAHPRSEADGGAAQQAVGNRSRASRRTSRRWLKQQSTAHGDETFPTASQKHDFRYCCRMGETPSLEARLLKRRRQIHMTTRSVPLLGNWHLSAVFCPDRRVRWQLRPEHGTKSRTVRGGELFQNIGFSADQLRQSAQCRGPLVPANQKRRALHHSSRSA